MSQYVFPEYSMAQPGPSNAVGSIGSTGSGINWGGAGAMAGASALSGIIQMMYQQQQEKRKREQELMQQQSEDAGKYGQNQQNMLGQLMGNWNKALGV